MKSDKNVMRIHPDETKFEESPNIRAFFHSFISINYREIATMVDPETLVHQLEWFKKRSIHGTHQMLTLSTLDFGHPQYHPPEYHTMPYPTLLYTTISPLFWRPPLIFELTCNTMSGDLTPESVELLHVISEPLKVELAYAPWEANTQRHPWKILTT